MAKIISILPESPQPRRIQEVVSALELGRVVVFPTETSYVLACHLADKQAQTDLRAIRRLSKRHELTLLCRDLQDIGSYAKVQNYAFRQLKYLTPGPYTFILKATKEVPNRLVHPNKKTIGLRVSGHCIANAIVSALQEPVLISTLILPDESEPILCPYEINESIGHQCAVIVDGGYGGWEQTSVVDMTGDSPIVVRAGLGDTSMF